MSATACPHTTDRTSWVDIAQELTDRVLMVALIVFVGVAAVSDVGTATVNVFLAYIARRFARV